MPLVRKEGGSHAASRDLTVWADDHLGLPHGLDSPQRVAVRQQMHALTLDDYVANRPPVGLRKEGSIDRRRPSARGLRIPPGLITRSFARSGCESASGRAEAERSAARPSAIRTQTCQFQ